MNRAPLGRTPTPARRCMLAVATLVAVGCASEPEADPGSTGGELIPAGTDIWMAPLHWEASGPPSVGDPTNITMRPGYDNQPHFVPDGSGLWYTAIDEQAGQADIWRYDFDPLGIARVTASNPESEYSAAPLPDGSGVSVIRVEADSTQRLWRFDHDGANASVILPDLAPVGYQAWADDVTLVMFVLGSPATLQRGNVRTGVVEVLAEDIGRSIQRIPDSNDVSFVQRNPDGSSTIMRLRAGAPDAEPIIDAIEGSEYHAWAPDGTLITSSGSLVYGWTEGVTPDWTPIGDFSSRFLTITRLAVSPDGSQIAMVGEVVL